MSSLTEDIANEDFARELLQTMDRLSDRMGIDIPTLDGPLDEKDSKREARQSHNVASTLRLLAENSSELEGMDTAAAETMGETLMQNMMKQFEKLGEKEDFHEVIDGMMKQLLSKDVLYGPMKQVTEAFPEWLAINEEKMSEEEYNRFGHMYQGYQRVIAVFESEPNNIPRIVELMQALQEHGQVI